MQAYEYYHAPFNFKDGIYASNFYLLTGFHGLHVMIGTGFLIICYLKVEHAYLTTDNENLCFKFASWYWHFVDIVWLFLFIFLYILGS